jgi:gas vesicle protein
MAESSQNNTGAAAILAFIAGVGAGVTAGLLFAPRSGEETRYRIKAKAEKTRADVEHKIAEEKHLVSDKIKEAKDRAKHVIDEGREAIKEKSS